MPLRMTLRADTGDDHNAVDSVFGRFVLRDPQQYGSFLSAHARVLAPIEIALEQAGIERLIPDWRERRRRERLADDLAALGMAAPPSLPPPLFSGDDEIWGAAYVLEGSKLGGAMLAKQVPDHLPSSYLSFQGPKGAMKTFMERLDAFHPADESRAIASARSTFALFRRAAELELELIPS
jgi:heme oxygenase (biliverdin-IX-beta and delta-forming)